MPEEKAEGAVPSFESKARVVDILVPEGHTLDMGYSRNIALEPWYVVRYINHSKADYPK